MWWLKVALLSAFVILNSVCGNPIDGELHNDKIQEEKFQISKSSVKGFKLDEPSTYRLPNDSIPISYDIMLTTNIHNGTKEFDGNVKIHLKIVEATNKITLHYKQITIDKISMWNTELTTVISSNLVFDYIQSHDFLVITLPQTYQPNTEFILEIQYNGLLRDDGAGFYWGNYAHGDEIRFYGATQFEINDARHAMPCYDEPGIRAVMKLTILHHKSYFAIANTNGASQELQGSDYMITQFAQTPKMQTYLLAFAISDYEYVNATINTRIPQRIFGIPSAIEEGHGDFAASVVGEILGKFEQTLGVEYPLDKMDHIALTKFNFGAMENFGLITYIDRGLLVNPALSESAKFNQQSSVISLIAHEYAHQWFGNIISPQWWTYTWLNEGFATLFANYVPHLLYPNRNFMRNFFTSTIQTAFARDGPDSWSMNHYTEDPERLWDKFGGIGYQKSGCVLRMFMEVLTPEVFLKGLNIYLTNNSMTAATPEELHAALQEAYKEANPNGQLNIGNLMYSWEDQAGYPLVSVSISGNSLSFKQRRYPVSNRETYAVPLTFATKTNANFTLKTPKEWLYSESMTFSQSSLGFTPNDWIVVNIDHVGYYRVDYDTALWGAIISQLNDKHDIIGIINRASLQDEFYLGHTEFGRVTGSDALKLLSYLDKEKEAIVWGRAQRNVNYLRERLFGTSAVEKFFELVKGITKVHLNELGYEGVDGEISDRTLFRSYTKALNCLALDGDCIIDEFTKLKAFFDTNEYSNSDLCAAIRLIDQEGFAKGIEIVMTRQNDTIRRSFLSYLGCTLNSLNQHELLNVVKDSSNGLSNGERLNLFSGLFRNSEEGMATALNFLNVNYSTILGQIDLNQAMLSMGSLINADPYKSTFNEILNKMVGLRHLSETQKQNIMAITENNDKWIENNYYGVLIHFDLAEETTSAPTSSPPSTSTSPGSTTSPPATTTDGAQSITVSFSLIIFGLIIFFWRV